MAEELTHISGPDKVAVTATSAPPASPPGYELRDEIGHGGMGVVYRARDVDLDRDVAVKLLSERYPADSPAAQRFLSEARITGQLQHPGIPAVHQVGTLADGRPFLAMKLIKGCTLEALLKQSSDPSAERGRLLAIFEAVCQAVGYAHAHHVIHRDLKPANVMVGAFGEVQVMDWGLAKVLDQASREHERPEDAAEETQAWTQVSPTPESGSHTQAGSLIGTPAFIPPEQAGGEIERVNERSDVFGLGALLSVILTGKPPYMGETLESVRVQALRGKREDCFARLDGCGAEPVLVVLCKKGLAFEPADRPADAGAVAAAVAGLRAAADVRARRAEVDKVRVEGEKAASEARSLERRKRRRLAAAAAAVLAAAVIGGLTAVLAVQRRANADLADKNHELADEQAKVQARFELAQKAIALFHTGVSEDMLLKNPGFKELRTKLLKQAADFYADLEKLLAGQTDARSRKALAAGYFQLGELTDKIGSKPEALAVHRKALAVRRELAAAEGADVETRLDVARSLEKVGQLLMATGDNAGALPAFEEALAIYQKLTDDNPAFHEYQSGLASTHHNLGVLLRGTGKPSEAEVEFRKALAIYQKLADDNPAVNE
jgi:serine/threonine protein kinase